MRLLRVVAQEYLDWPSRAAPIDDGWVRRTKRQAAQSLLPPGGNLRSNHRNDHRFPSLPPPAGPAFPHAAPTFVAAVAQPPRRFLASSGRCSACHAPAVTAPPAGVAGSRRPSGVCYRQVRRVLPGRPGGGKPGPFRRLVSCAAMPGRTLSRSATGLPCPRGLMVRARRRGKASWPPPA